MKKIMPIAKRLKKIGRLGGARRTRKAIPTLKRPEREKEIKEAVLAAGRQKGARRMKEPASAAKDLGGGGGRQETGEPMLAAALLLF